MELIDRAPDITVDEQCLQQLREREPALKSVEVFLRADYRSEYDAMSLLHTLGNLYEPLRLFGRSRETRL